MASAMTEPSSFAHHTIGPQPTRRPRSPLLKRPGGSPRSFASDERGYDRSPPFLPQRSNMATAEEEQERYRQRVREYDSPPQDNLHRLPHLTESYPPPTMRTLKDEEPSARSPPLAYRHRASPLSTKRPGSPLLHDEEYDAPPHARSVSHQGDYYGRSAREDGEESWVPDNRRARSPLDGSYDREIKSRSQENTRWKSPIHDTTRSNGLAAAPFPRSSFSASNSPHEDRPTLPALSGNGSGSMFGSSRFDSYRLPPMNEHNRFHGGSMSSSGSSNDHPQPHNIPQYAYRSNAGMPRSSLPSLRSLSMPYPYESPSTQHAHAQRGGHENGTGEPARADSGGHSTPYYDGSPSLRQEQAHPSRGSSSLHSSPRHHPYAMSHGQSHHAPSSGHAYESGSAQAGVGSPTSMPRRRGKLPKPVTDLLKSWLLDHSAHPYPTEEEKRRLCASTGLSISQVSNWFINARRRILIPQGSGHFGIGPSASGSGAESGNGQYERRQHSPNSIKHSSDHHSIYAPPPSHSSNHLRHSIASLPPPSNRHHQGGMPSPLPPLSSQHHGMYRNGPDVEPYSRSAEQSPRMRRDRYESP
ncbi:uncharacterized protein FA14DRAFT_177557 [Meira miltonrushii]|uniref:Homeobox domain-containing protein n=1 Tax=Meira miltonrushii TaxID=1280837 RepID=A0A316VLX2_9BASI|nr:uncharacterized protein FA14DRAFT_177557 [Meira miltonrushii]PWN38284.1 hypothetical protein FA14DRAFT_177557 [Meira miltonrushii]